MAARVAGSNDAQIGGDDEPIEPREGEHGLVHERVAVGAHLRRHRGERVPQMVGDEKSARRARAVGGHWFFRARMRIQYTPPKRAREDASSIEDADAAKRAELRGGGLQ